MEDSVQALTTALKQEKEAKEKAEELLLQRTGELLETQAAFKQKSIEFDSIFSNLLDSYILMDTMGNVLKMNESAKEFFGYDLEKEAFNVVNIIHEDDVAYAMNSFADLIEKGSFRDYEARIYTKNKDIKWVQINANLIYDEEGKIVAAQGLVRDITSSKNSIRQFSEQQEQLAAIFDNSSLGIILMENNHIVKANKAFQKLMRFPEETLLNKKIVDFLSEESKDDIAEKEVDILSGEKDQYTAMLKYEKKNGSSFLSKTNVTAIRNTKGDIKYQLAYVEDITEKYKRRLILNTLNNLTRSFIGKLTIHDIAWEIANVTAHELEFEDCVVYLVNKEEKVLEQIAGYGAEVDENKEIINKLYIPFGKGLVGTVALTGVAEIVKDTTKDDRYVVDDKERYSEITVPIIINGEVVGVIDSEHSSKNFFTKEHLRLLKNVANLVSIQLTNTHNLERRIEAESQNEELLENLKRSNKELQDFAHIVSHDLKSPLRSINALISWFQEDYEEVLDDEAEVTFNKLNDKLEQMDALIDGILRYSSVSDKNIKQDQKVSVAEILQEIEVILDIPDHIQFIYPDNLPIIQANKIRIKQLFQNLISNAIYYTTHDQGKIEVKFRELKNYWKFTVTDNGVGIAENYHDKIFKIFQTLDKKGKSTGIGLSIVKKIIELYKGEIQVKSAEGKGTSFIFTLKK